MKNRPSATGDLVAATPSQETKGSRSKRGQRSKQKRSEPLCDLKYAAKGMVVLDEIKACHFIRKDSIENSFVLDEKPFASGLFATVRRVRDKATGVIYAAKYAARDRYGVDSTSDIMHELGLLSVCRPCPRIVKLHAAYDTPTDLILVMDYACGGDLQTVLDADIIPFEHDASRFTKQLMEALVFLHDRHIVHLDIKPQNLVLTGPFPDCDIKLCDLEISRVVSEEEQIREILGTPDYVAPEILHFEPISLAADIWSSGVLAYVLLTGFTPFGGDTDQETFCNISRCHVDFPNELFEDVSDNAKNFIKWLLVRSPKDRPCARDCLRHPWLGSSRKPHEKETIASEAQRKNIVPGGGCPRSSSSMQHLALQRNNITKSREILLDRVASLTNLRKSTSKSRERLCEMRLSLSRSRDHLLDIQRAVTASREAMGQKLLSRSQEFLSHKLHSPDTSAHSEANEYSFNSSLDMSVEKTPQLMSPKVEKPTDLIVARAQSFCQSSEVLGHPLVEVPEEEDENQDKSETEINIDAPRTDSEANDKVDEQKRDQGEFSSVTKDEQVLKMETEVTSKPIEPVKRTEKHECDVKPIEVEEKVHESKPVENKEKVPESQAKLPENKQKNLSSNAKVMESKEKTVEPIAKSIETKEKAWKKPIEAPKNHKEESLNPRNQSEETTKSKAETSGNSEQMDSTKQKPLTISNILPGERGSSELPSEAKMVPIFESKKEAVVAAGEVVKEAKAKEETILDVEIEAGNASKQEIDASRSLSRKTSRQELVLKLETATPPSTPIGITVDPFSQAAANADHRLTIKKLDEIANQPEERCETEDSTMRPFLLSKPKRPPPLEVSMQSLPSIPSPPTDAAKEDPGTPRAYFLDKLRSFRDKLTQSMQRQSSDGSKTNSQPTSPLCETSQKKFIEVPEDEQKIPAELLNRRRASWAHGLRQEPQVEQKPSVAQLVQTFLVTKSEPVKGLSVIEPRKLKMDWRRSESTESLNEKPEKAVVPQSRKLRTDWRKPDEEKVEKHEVKIQEEEKPSKPIASIALAFEMAAAHQTPQPSPVKSKVPLTPPVRRKNSFERSRPAQLMAEVASLPKLLEVTSPREEDDNIPAAFERKIEEVKVRPKSVEIVPVVRKAVQEKPIIKNDPPVESRDVSTNQEKKSGSSVVLLRKKKDKSRESNDVCSQTFDADFSKKGEKSEAAEGIDPESSTSLLPSSEEKPTTSKHTRSGSVSSDTGCSELSSDALSDRSSTGSAGNWEDGEKKPDTKSAETQTSSLEDVSDKPEWRGRNRSHSVQADLSFIAQPWGRVCTGSVARAFEKFGSKNTERSRSFRVRRQSTIL